MPKRKEEKEKKEVKAKHNRNYYDTVTKIKRQLKKDTKKAEYAYSQLDADTRAKKDVTINYILERKWTHFGVFKEELYGRNGNEYIRHVNKSIKAINKALPKHQRLPALPLNKITLRSLSKYAMQYFTILHHERIINKAIWTIEQTNKGVWHVHALIDLYDTDVYTDRLTHYWKLNTHTFCEPIECLRRSVIYITKNWKTYSNKETQDIQFSLTNSVGDFSITKTYNPLRRNISHTERLQYLNI